MSAPLRIEGLRVAGGTGPAIDFELPSHTGVSIVGEETSGIDALARIALGRRPPADGRIVIFDTDIRALPRSDALAFRRRVGYLPAGDGLLQNLTLRDNIALPLRFGSDFTDREIDGRLNVLLATVRLTDAARYRPAQVSDEQRRRATLARALAFDPKLVLLDQPFVGLTQRAARDIVDLARGGETADGSRRTVLALGHSLPHAIHSRFERRFRLTSDGLIPLG